MKYRLYNYDVWGNSKDGYEVNDCFKSDMVIELEDNLTDKQIVQRLKQEGFINKTIKDSKVTIDGEQGYTLYFEYLNKPEFELRAEIE